MNLTNRSLLLTTALNFMALVSMEAPEKIEPVIPSEPEIIYTTHAKDKMAKYNLDAEDVERIIQKGQRFLDTKYPGAILYREVNKGKSKLLSVATRPIENTKNILIITVFYAEQPGNKPRKRR